MAGIINKLKDAITGEPADSSRVSSTAAGAHGNDGYNTGTHGSEGKFNSGITDSDYNSTNRSGLGSNTGLSSGVEGSRLTNQGGIGQVGHESRGVGQGLPGSTGHIGSTDNYGGVDSSRSQSGVAGLEHHGRHGEGLTGSTGRHERERELETGAIGSGFAGGNQARSGEYSGAGTTGIGGTGGSHLTKADIEGRIEPHRHENENFHEYASPSAFSHGKHHGIGETGTTGEFGSGTTGTGIGSGTGRSSGVGNEYGSSGRNDPYDNQTGSNTGSGTAPHKSSLLNKLDPRVDNQAGRNI